MEAKSAMMLAIESGPRTRRFGAPRDTRASAALLDSKNGSNAMRGGECQCQPRTCCRGQPHRLPV